MTTAEQLDNEYMDAIVSDGIAFMRSITNAFGSETGMELWDTIANTLHPAIKGKIFFAMLTGTHDDRVTLTGSVAGTNKIVCIKIIRGYTGMGLRESKEAYEQAGDYGKPITLKVDPKQRRAMIDELRQNGMIVS
jgi:ribosomal protein L7/L12